MSTLIPFLFEDAHLVRGVIRDGEPWFVLADVCRVLEIGNPSQAATRLDDDERATLTNNEGQAGQGAQSFTIINESGLYSLILTSRKPAAKRFKKWVTAEVLPSIRKTGAYAAPGAEPPPVSGSEMEQHHLALLREARLTFGRAFAQALWRHLSMPFPDAAADAATGATMDTAAMDTPIDTVAAFLATCTEYSQGYRVSSLALWSAYQDWCLKREAVPLTRNAFGRVMTSRGFRTLKASVNYFIGLRMLTDDVDVPAAPGTKTTLQ